VSGSWLAWDDDTAVHYMEIHSGTAIVNGQLVQLAGIPSSQSAALGLRPVAHTVVRYYSYGQTRQTDDLTL